MKHSNIHFEVKCCLSLTRTSCPELRGWIRYLLDLARLLHQKHYRQRRHLLAELSIESKYALKMMKVVLHTSSHPEEQRSPWPRQRHSQPHILAMSCPGVQAPWGDVKDALNPRRQHLQATATVTAGFTELVTSRSLCMQANILLEKLDAHGLKGSTRCWVENGLNGCTQRVVVNLNPAGGWSPVVSPRLSTGARPGFLIFQDSKQRKSVSGSYVKKAS